MASYTQVSYLANHLGVAAFSGSFLYFVSVAMFVRIEAKRSHAVKLEDDAAPSLKEVLKGGWHFLLPLIVLVAALVHGFTPTYAAGIAILSVVVASWLSKHPMGLRDILDALVMGTRNITTTAILLITVGLIVMVVSTTGIGKQIFLMITDLGRWKLADYDSTGRFGLLDSGDGAARNGSLYCACHAFSASDIQPDCAEPVGRVDGEWQPARAGQGHFYAGADKLSLLDAPMGCSNGSAVAFFGAGYLQ